MEDYFENFSKVSYTAFEKAFKDKLKSEFQIGEKAYVSNLVNGKRKEYCIKEVRLCGEYYTNNGILNGKRLYGIRLYVDENGNIYKSTRDFVCADRNVICKHIVDAYDGKIVEKGEDAL